MFQQVACHRRDGSPEGKDGALDGTHRGRGSAIAFGVSAALLAMLIATAAPSAAVMPRAASTSGAVALFPMAEVDLDGFAARAAAWSAARREHRAESVERALEAAADGRAAEAERIAAADAARIAEEEARAEAARQAAIAATSTTTVAPTTSASTTPDDGTNPPAADPPSADPLATDPPADDVGGPTAAQWESLRQCESAGNYAAVSLSGRYRGAYQFSRGTWDWVAGFANPSLIGVDPAAASPADQDALALALWQARGWGPWPVCGAGV